MHTFSRAVALVGVLALVATMVLAGLVVTAPGARAGPDQVSWFDVGTISSANGFNRAGAVVVTNGTTSMWVFYYTTTTATGVTNINVTKYSLGTGILGMPTFVSDKQVNNVANVVDPYEPMSATMDSSGNLYVAWNHIPVPGSAESIYVSKSTDGGATWLPAVPVTAASTVSDNYGPSIATNAAGTVYVAWTQVWASTFENVTVAQSTNGGNSFINPTNASGEGPQGAAVRPSLSADSAGRLYISYWGVNPTGPTPYHVNVTTSDDGVSWAAPTQLTPDSTLAFPPSTYVDASGNAHVFWLDYRGLLTTGAPTFWQSVSTNHGASWSAGAPISQGLSTPNAYASVSGHGNEIMVAWPSNHNLQHGLSYVVSEDGGLTWTDEKFYYPGYSVSGLNLASDQNGTFYAAAEDSSGAYTAVDGLLWMGPPSAPVITSVAPGTGSLTVTWAASPEPDVASYRVLRSTNGVDYRAIATVNVGTTSHTDSGLANGTYWYEIVAVDGLGTTSVASVPDSGTLGPTVAQLQSEITALQSELNTANANLASIQTQLDGLKGQLSGLQGNTTALQNQIAALQNQLNTLQGQQATQTMSYANLAFEIIVVVLLVVLLLNQMRKPKNPTLVMAQPGQVEPKKPDEEL